MEIPDDVIDDLEELGGIEGLKDLAPDPSLLGRLERIYTLLSAKGRIEIIYFLNFTEMTPGMLSYLTGMRPNLLSFHLKRLESAGLIHSRKEGRFAIYSLTETGKSLSGPIG